MGITYKKSGVDIQKAGIFKNRIKHILKSSFSNNVLKGVGGFGSFFSLGSLGYKKPVLVSSADGVGTKLKIATLINRHDTVGIDAVAMNVNDILCTGAKPLFFLDYIAFSKLEEETLVDIVKGLNKGCIISGCSLIGGETAQMPGMYAKGEYDLAGFCVGVVDKDKIIDGSSIRPGNIIIGLESNGLHSNGYSLVRKVFSQAELKRMGLELLKPTRIYVKPLLSLLRDNETAKQRNSVIRGIAHITGGAFYDKVLRILPRNIDAHIFKDSWPVPKIFSLIQKRGCIENKEMYHTLNMGIGMVLFVDRSSAEKIIDKISGFGLRAWQIGQAVKGNGRTLVV